MQLVVACWLAICAPQPLAPGDHTRELTVGQQKRTYLVHVPPKHDPKKPATVVLALHGAAMNGPMMAGFCGLNPTADEAGFLAVYPNGTGTGPFLTWNAGGLTARWAKGRVDDVAYIAAVIDDVARATAVDPKRVYACGMSNGAMMCYRLAAELSDRIAAIAPVAGTIAIAESHPKRPVSVLHFHGTKDALVPFAPPADGTRRVMRLAGVEESVQTWVKLDGCSEKPKVETLSPADDPMKVTRRTWSGGKDGSEVALVIIEGGGHTWPGQVPAVSLLGKSTTSVSANRLIWEFFQKHPMK